MTNGFWNIVVPEATINYVLNPSAEAAGNFAACGSATVTRVVTTAGFGLARFGSYSYHVEVSSDDEGIELTLAALPNAAAYVTLYIKTVVGFIGSDYQATLDGTNWHTLVRLNGPAGGAGGWARYGVSIVAGQANGSTTLRIRNTVAGSNDLWFDGIQVESKAYYTTYIDGDRPGGSWSGLYHASTSSRDAQERSGGRERNLLSDYSIAVLRDVAGIGMPPIVNNVQLYALQPGAEYQSVKVMPRTIDLHLDLEGASAQGLHQKRQAMIDLVKPDRVRGAQPIVLGYAGANSDSEVYGAFRYDAGLEFGEYSGFDEQPVLRLLAVDPFWFEDDRGAALLTLQNSVSNAAYGLRRSGGQWQALGTGFNGAVYAVTADPKTGRVYFGGAFTTANGVTVNGIGYWNGSTFVAMGGTPGVTGGNVLAMAIAPNGDVWIGGSFTAVGGSATQGLARWNLASSTWTAFNVSVTNFIGVYALAIKPSSGLVVIGGNFENWNGTANADYIATYDGSTWAALSTGANGQVAALTYTLSELLIAGGDYTTIGGVSANRIASWNGTAWSAMGAGCDADVRGLITARDSTVYLCGDFTTPGSRIAAWNGSAFAELGSGLNSDCESLALDSQGNLIAAGDFTTAGGVAVADRIAGWNGTSWYHLDVDLPGSPVMGGVAFLRNDLFIGFNTSGTATAGALTTVTSVATVQVFPIFVLIGPTSGSCILQWLENQSTGQRMYFDLTVGAGEVITIDLSAGEKVVTSDWRGVIASQPFRSSDDFALLPGDNVIAAFVSGTTTGASLVCYYPIKHWSVDGVA